MDRPTSSSSSSSSLFSISLSPHLHDHDGDQYYSSADYYVSTSSSSSYSPPFSPSSSHDHCLSPLFADRFHDIPDMLRNEMMTACQRIMKRRLVHVADEVRGLMLHNCKEKGQRLALSLCAAKKMGFDVKAYERRLARLMVMAEAKEHMMERDMRRQERIAELQAELARLKADGDKAIDELADLAVDFSEVALAPL